MATWESNGHVTDDVTRSRKFKGVNPIMLKAQYLGNGWKYILGDNGAPVKISIWDDVR